MTGGFRKASCNAGRDARTTALSSVFPAVLRATPTLLIPAVLLAGCQRYEAPETTRETAKMGAAERASYLAIVHYVDCMEPLVRATKRGAPLSDAQINELGHLCPIELHDAVLEHDAWLMTRQHDVYDDSQTIKLSPAERLREQERFLAAAFWCDFRTCNAM
ncbi:MAG: hypothetical protein JWM65_1958 [Sphingomonas bacterium]|nr:hypothetical protein [Sphingomonas bacterium]